MQSIKMGDLIKNQKGQSLLEMLVALFILVTALTATVVLIVNSINASRESKNKLIATNLAREGIEAVRNIRDSNWIDPNVVNWNDGISGADNTAIPIIDGASPLSLDFSVNGISEVDARIWLGGNDYLQGIGLTGVETIFFRILFFNPICQDNANPAGERIVDKNDNYSCGQGGTYVSTYPDQIGIRVISEVHWPGPNKRNVILEERLYDWQVL